MKAIVPEVSLQILSRQIMQEMVDEQRKEFKLIGSQKRIPGLILFEYDLTTGEIRQASMKKVIQLNMDGTTGAKSRVDSKDLCLYVQALNEENARRKVAQLLRRKTVRKQLFNPQNNG